MGSWKKILSPLFSVGAKHQVRECGAQRKPKFLLYLQVRPRRFHPKINKNHPKQGRWISKVAASHFFNANKEVINAIEANSTPKSTIDANKFGETLFF